VEAERQEGSAAPVGEEAEVADAHEAAREQVEEEAAQELIDGQGHEPLLVRVSGISPAEGDVAVGEGNESVVGDGDLERSRAGSRRWSGTAGYKSAACSAGQVGPVRAGG
jgi:hypothetical protein